MPGNFLLTEIQRTATKGQTSTTTQSQDGSVVQTSTEAANTVVTTQGAATAVTTTKDDVGIGVSFEVTFKNRQPVPPVGEEPPDACP